MRLLNPGCLALGEWSYHHGYLGMKIFFVQFFLYSCHLFLISSASVRSIPFLSFFEPIFSWNVPLVSLIWWKRSLVFPVVFLSFFAVIAEESFLISPCYSSELCIQMLISFLSLLLFTSLFSQLFVSLPQTAILLFLTHNIICELN